MAHRARGKNTLQFCRGCKEIGGNMSSKKIPAILLIISFCLAIFSGCTGNEKARTSSGKYYESNDVSFPPIGNCTIRSTQTVSGGWKTYADYYDKNGKLVGSCGGYSGPGMSMGPSSSCPPNSPISRASDPYNDGVIYWNEKYVCYPNG